MLCVQCGGQLKDSANFCKYCGGKVANKNPEPPEHPEHPQPTFIEKTPEIVHEKSESLFDKAILANDEIITSATSDSYNNDEVVDPFLHKEVQEKFDPITDDIIDILYSRERDVDIKTELKEILEEVEKVDQRLEIGLVTENDARPLIHEKQELISALRTERKSLKKDKLSVELLGGELADIKDKLDKLHIMYNEGKISNESVYEKLKTEYSDSYTQKDEFYSHEKNNLTNWLTILEFDVFKMKEDIDIFNTKAGIGEIEKEDADSKIKLLEIDIYRKELAYHSLKAIEKEITN